MNESLKKNRRILISVTLIGICLIGLILVIWIMSPTNEPSRDEIADWVDGYVTVGETTPDQLQQIISDEFQEWNCDSEEFVISTSEAGASANSRTEVRCSKVHRSFYGTNLLERIGNYAMTFKLYIIDFEFQVGILDNIEIGIAHAP